MPPRRPRVLFVGSFVTDHPEQGGLNAQCLQLLASPLGERIEFVLLDSTPPYLPPPPLPTRGWLAAKRLVRCAGLLIGRRPDVFLIFSSGGFSFLEKGVMAWMARATGTPVVWSVRAGVFRSQVESSRAFAAVSRVLLRAADRILCQGSGWARFYEEELTVEPARLVIQPNWIKADCFLSLPGPEPDRSGPLRVLFVGHANRAKGIFELVEAILTRPGLRDAHLDVVGDGADLTALRDLVEQRGGQDRIAFHGWQTGEDLLRWFGDADLFVLPSHAEGFPNVLLEAMAAALPVVVTPVGAVPDVFETGRNGILVPVKDVDLLGEAIEALKDDPEARVKMGRNNRLSVADFRVEAAADRLWTVFSSVSTAFGGDETTRSSETVTR